MKSLRSLQHMVQYLPYTFMMALYCPSLVLMANETCYFFNPRCTLDLVRSIFPNLALTPDTFTCLSDKPLTLHKQAFFPLLCSMAKSVAT